MWKSFFLFQRESWRWWHPHLVHSSPYQESGQRDRPSPGTSCWLPPRAIHDLLLPMISFAPKCYGIQSCQHKRVLGQQNNLPRISCRGCHQTPTTGCFWVLQVQTWLPFPQWFVLVHTGKSLSRQPPSQLCKQKRVWPNCCADTPQVLVDLDLGFPEQVLVHAASRSVHCDTAVPKTKCNSSRWQWGRNAPVLLLLPLHLGQPVTKFCSLRLVNVHLDNLVVELLHDLEHLDHIVYMIEVVMKHQIHYPKSPRLHQLPIQHWSSCPNLLKMKSLNSSGNMENYSHRRSWCWRRIADLGWFSRLGLPNCRGLHNLWMLSLISMLLLCLIHHLLHHLVGTLTAPMSVVKANATLLRVNFALVFAFFAIVFSLGFRFAFLFFLYLCLCCHVLYHVHGFYQMLRHQRVHSSTSSCPCPWSCLCSCLCLYSQSCPLPWVEVYLLVSWRYSRNVRPLHFTNVAILSSER